MGRVRPTGAPGTTQGAETHGQGPLGVTQNSMPLALQRLSAGMPGHTDEGGEHTETHFLLQSHEVKAGQYNQEIQQEPLAGAAFLEGFQNESPLSDCLTFVYVECTHREVYLWQMCPGKFLQAEYTWVTSAQTRKWSSNSLPPVPAPPESWGSLGHGLSCLCLALMWMEQGCVWPLV